MKIYTNKILSIVFLILSTFLFCQENVEDSLITTICHDLPHYKNLSDKDKIRTTFKLHLLEYLGKKEPAKRDSIYRSFESRLQGKCDAYMDIRDRISKHKPGNWDYLKKIPESKLTDEQITEFKNTRHFYYIQKDGMKVNVIIDHNEWRDLFPNHTFSRLQLEWLTETSFQIEFIESNNINRKGASRKGDQYVYNIIERNADSYKLVLTTSQNNRIVSFNFYPVNE